MQLLILSRKRWIQLLKWTYIGLYKSNIYLSSFRQKHPNFPYGNILSPVLVHVVWRERLYSWLHLRVDTWPKLVNIFYIPRNNWFSNESGTQVSLTKANFRLLLNNSEDNNIREDINLNSRKPWRRKSLRMKSTN